MNTVIKYLKYILMLPKYVTMGIIFVMDFIASIGAFVLNSDYDSYDSYSEYLLSLTIGILLVIVALILVALTLIIGLIIISLIIALIKSCDLVIMVSIITIIALFFIISYLHYKGII